MAVAIRLKLNCENLSRAHTLEDRICSDSHNDLCAARDKALILKATFEIQQLMEKY